MSLIENANLNQIDQEKNEDQKRILFENKRDLPQITIRSILLGLIIGCVVLISNFQFGLQTGWISMMSMSSSLLAYSIAKVLGCFKNFTDVENVFTQSVSVAVGTAPLTFGLISIIPVIEKMLKPEETTLSVPITFTIGQLFLWCLGLCFFGIFFAMALRKMFVTKKNLRFPTGYATAVLLSILHKSEIRDDNPNSEFNESYDELIDFNDDKKRYNTTFMTNLFEYKTILLLVMFLFSFFYSIFTYFFPILKELPIFGTNISNEYLWNLQPSPAYFGQGMIMGIETVTDMLIGAILGWGILIPIAKKKKWISDDINDINNGGQSWIVWISLSIMSIDSLISFLMILTRSIYKLFIRYQRYLINKKHKTSTPHNYSNRSLEVFKKKKSIAFNVELIYSFFIHKLKNNIFQLKNIDIILSIIGTILSSVLCIFLIINIFKNTITFGLILFSILISLICSILAIKSLGETDINPISGIGKLSQLLISLMISKSNPNKILIILIAGAISESSAQQSGDLMQDLKTGYLLGSNARSQLVAQIIGSVFSVFFGSLIYKLYNNIYTIPSNVFRIPSGMIWMDCARVIVGGSLPPNALKFSLVFIIFFGIISLIKNSLQFSHHKKIFKYFPNGVSVGVGLYNIPNFTIARFAGGLIAYMFQRHCNNNSNDEIKTIIIIASSGLILGEGLSTIVSMLLTFFKVKHF